MTNKQPTIERLGPMLREFFWLIQQDRISQDMFVKDMVHRINLLTKEEENAKLRELVKGAVVYVEMLKVNRTVEYWNSDGKSGNLLGCDEWGKKARAIVGEEGG